MTIKISERNDISVLNNRYAVCYDIDKRYRVVSLVSSPHRELQGRHTGGGLSYVFNRTGTGASFYKESYNQAELARLVTRYGKNVTNDQYSRMVQDGAVVAINEPVRQVSTGTGKTAFAPLSTFGGGYVIAIVTDTGLLFGSKPKVHATQDLAEAELERLANVSPGTEFVMLKAQKAARAATVTVREFV